MSKSKPKIALIGAGGASFGTVTIYEAVRAQGLRGSELMLIDIAPERLELARATGERMNAAQGSPLTITTDTNTARGIEGADFIVLSVEVGRWKYWLQDLDVPRKHGSPQDMGECGGPGGLFHALRTIPLVLSICRIIEEVAPDALLINVTNPLPRVNMAIHHTTRLNCIGDCPEFRLALPRLSMRVRTPINKIVADAWGLNHITWYHNITHADTGEDLYPRLRRHAELFPFLHGKLGLKYFEEYGVYPISSDSHIGEYLPSGGPGTRSVLPRWFPYQQFSEWECSMRVRLTQWYADGKFELPWRLLPAAVEGSMQTVAALITGAHTRVDAVNVLNEGYIPNLPPWAVVEVPAETEDGRIVPATVPPVDEPLAARLNEQCEIQKLIADSVLQRDPELAFQALCRDPLAPPTDAACRATFDEMLKLQKDVLPF